VGHGTSKYRKLKTSKPRLFPVANKPSRPGIIIVVARSQYYSLYKDEQKWGLNVTVKPLLSAHRWIATGEINKTSSQCVAQREKISTGTCLVKVTSEMTFPVKWFLFHFHWVKWSLCYFRDMRLRRRLSCLVPENMAFSSFVWGEK